MRHTCYLARLIAVRTYLRVLEFEFTMCWFCSQKNTFAKPRTSFRIFFIPWYETFLQLDSFDDSLSFTEGSLSTTRLARFQIKSSYLPRPPKTQNQFQSTIQRSYWNCEMTRSFKRDRRLHALSRLQCERARLRALSHSRERDSGTNGCGPWHHGEQRGRSQNIRMKEGQK